jgi:hypothetical protein
MVALLFVVMDWSDVRTLKRSKVVAVVVGNGGDEGAGFGGRWGLVRRAFVTASLSLLIARHEGGSKFARRAGGRSAGARAMRPTRA